MPIGKSATFHRRGNGETLPLILKRELRTKFLGIAAGLSLFLIATSYLVLNFYIRTTAKELISNWAQAEAISLQEGNYLTAFSKSQRILISSNLVKGAALIEVSRGGTRNLVEFGDAIALPIGMDIHVGSQVVQTGAFSFLSIYKMSSEESLIAVFLIKPSYYLWFLGIILFVVIGFAIFSLLAIRRIERLEAKNRESVVQLAIGGLVAGDSPADVLKIEYPQLVSRWSEMRARIDELRDNERRVAIQSATLELALQIAHDIRSPLTALNILASSKSINALPEAELLKQATARISSIAESLLSSQKNPPTDIRKESTNVSIWKIVSAILNEKKIEFQNRPGINITLNGDADIEMNINKIELGRMISNLVNNAAEAISGNGVISTTVSKDDEKLRIVVSDSGKGIPAEIIPVLLKEGGSFGKSQGHGLGLLHAVKFCESVGGSLSITSELGVGTQVVASFPLTMRNINV